MSSIRSVLIDDIENAENKILHVNFEEYIEDIKSTTPVYADLTIKSLGDLIEVSGNVNVNLILECDLCLKEFDYELDFEIDEMFAKGTLLEEYGQELELKDGQFVTDLEGSREIDIYDLLYQSVILNLPNKKVCGINCNEGLFQTDEDFQISDSRMEVFKNIKIEK